jgi:hypothetical protein
MKRKLNNKEKLIRIIKNKYFILNIFMILMFCFYFFSTLFFVLNAKYQQSLAASIYITVSFLVLFLSLGQFWLLLLMDEITFIPQSLSWVVVVLILLSIPLYWNLVLYLCTHKKRRVRIISIIFFSIVEALLIAGTIYFLVDLQLLNFNAYRLIS